MSFEDIVLKAIKTPELVAEFDRLTGSNLQKKGSPLDQMIDQATGRNSDELEMFVSFVFACICLPIIEGGDRF